jgi:hypothetical protein
MSVRRCMRKSKRKTKNEDEMKKNRKKFYAIFTLIISQGIILRSQCTDSMLLG